MSPSRENEIHTLRHTSCCALSCIHSFHLVLKRGWNHAFTFLWCRILGSSECWIICIFWKFEHLANSRQSVELLCSKLTVLQSQIGNWGYLLDGKAYFQVYLIRLLRMILGMSTPIKFLTFSWQPITCKTHPLVVLIDSKCGQTVKKLG